MHRLSLSETYRTCLLILQLIMSLKHSTTLVFAFEFIDVQGDDGGFDDDGNAAHGYDDDTMDHEYLDSAGEEELMDSGGEREDDKVFTVQQRCFTYL